MTLNAELTEQLKQAFLNLARAKVALGADRIHLSIPSRMHAGIVVCRHRATGQLELKNQLYTPVSVLPDSDLTTISSYSKCDGSLLKELAAKYGCADPETYSPAPDSSLEMKGLPEWCGPLAPQPLKQAQDDFIRALETSIKLANIKTGLLDTLHKFNPEGVQQ